MAPHRPLPPPLKILTSYIPASFDGPTLLPVALQPECPLLREFMERAFTVDAALLQDIIRGVKPFAGDTLLCYAFLLKSGLQRDTNYFQVCLVVTSPSTGPSCGAETDSLMHCICNFTHPHQAGVEQSYAEISLCPSLACLSSLIHLTLYTWTPLSTAAPIFERLSCRSGVRVVLADKSVRVSTSRCVMVLLLSNAIECDYPFSKPEGEVPFGCYVPTLIFQPTLSFSEVRGGEFPFGSSFESY